MKKYLAIPFIILLGCTGSLTKEQRKEMLKARESTEIKRVSDSEIMEMALQQGTRALGKLDTNDSPAKIESVANQLSARVKWVAANAPALNIVDKKLMEAYRQTDVSIENLQRLGNDSVLVTKSVFGLDSVTNVNALKGMWHISFSKKELIKAM